MSEGDRPVPRIVGERELYRGFVRLTKVSFEIDWDGERRSVEREVHDHGDVGSVLPVDPERGMCILLRQFRLTPVLDGEDGWIWEAPAGLLEGATPADCARAEAREEAGVEIVELHDLGPIRSSPGIVKERVGLFWGTYSGPPPAAIGGLADEHEMIEVHELPLSRAAAMNDEGLIIDAKTSITIYRLRHARPDLFASRK